MNSAPCQVAREREREREREMNRSKKVDKSLHKSNREATHPLPLVKPNRLWAAPASVHLLPMLAPVPILCPVDEAQVVIGVVPAPLCVLLDSLQKLLLKLRDRSPTLSRGKRQNKSAQPGVSSRRLKGNFSRRRPTSQVFVGCMHYPGLHSGQRENETHIDTVLGVVQKVQNGRALPLLAPRKTESHAPVEPLDKAPLQHIPDDDIWSTPSRSRLEAESQGKKDPRACRHDLVRMQSTRKMVRQGAMAWPPGRRQRCALQTDNQIDTCFLYEVVVSGSRCFEEY